MFPQLVHHEALIGEVDEIRPVYENDKSRGGCGDLGAIEEIHFSFSRRRRRFSLNNVIDDSVDLSRLFSASELHKKASAHMEDFSDPFASFG